MVAIIPRRARRALARRTANTLVRALDTIGLDLWSGRGVRTGNRGLSGIRPFDRRNPDYQWWSRFRNGEEPGYELASAAFAQPTLSVLLSHIMGDGFTVDTGNGDADKIFARMLSRRMDAMLTWLADSMALGDAYMVVNPDATFRRVPPHVAEAMVDGLDYTRAIGYRFRMQLDDKVIEDTFNFDGRIQKIDNDPEHSYMPYTPGMLPVVHLPWDKVENQLYGRPVYRALRYTFKRYHDILENASMGVELQGQPVPVFTGLRSPGETANKIATGQDAFLSSQRQGYGYNSANWEERPVLELGSRSAYFLDPDSDFKFASPGRFADDHLAILKHLFHNVIEHLRIPEYVWGNAIPSSHASAQAQTAPFVRAIEGHRGYFEPYLMHLMKAWYLAALNAKAYDIMPEPPYEPMPEIADLPAIDLNDLRIDWPPIEEDSAEVLLKTVQAALAAGLITRKTALRKLDLVDNPEAEVEEAQQESDDDMSRDFTMVEPDEMMLAGANGMTNGTGPAGM